jgi:predicted phosphodiesterase
MAEKIKIVAISDTHTLHEEVIIPECDILIHAGDYTSTGLEDEVKDFLCWFSHQPARYKVFINGNHDRHGESRFNSRTGADLWMEELWNKYVYEVPDIVYLENSAVWIEGIKIWGSPITPDFYPQNWAHNMPRGEKIKKVWNTIPEDTDIVVTHGPAYGVLDKVNRGERVGCQDLQQALYRVNPKIHICGHIHEGYGTDRVVDTGFFNVSICNEYYRPINKPVIIEL